MPDTHRTSLERHNAPYRGISSREDDVNFNLAVLHDITYAEKISGGNDSFPGHKQQIKGNFTSIYHGEGEITSSIPTAGTLVTKKEELAETGLGRWTSLGGATLLEEPGWNTWSLSGSTHQSGISLSVPLEPGDVLVLRSQVSATTTTPGTRFAWGAVDFHGDEEHLDFYSTPDFKKGSGKKAGVYLEKRLHSESRQVAKICFYAVHGNQGTTVLSLTDFSLSLYAEHPAGVSGIDASIKPRLDGTRNQLLFLEDQILEKKGEWK